MIFTAPVFIKPRVSAWPSLSGFCSTYFFRLFHIIHTEPHDVRMRVRVLVFQYSLPECIAILNLPAKSLYSTFLATENLSTWKCG